MNNIRIALVGDYNASLTSHITIAPALEMAAKALGADVEPVWIHTLKLSDNEAVKSLRAYHGIWCVPGPPYANINGAISAISLARTASIPFLGTCAGFQYALIEYFKNVAGMSDVAHAEVNPEATHPLISELSCSLVDVYAPIHLVPRTLCARLYGTNRVEEGYRCSYGFNPDFAELLQHRVDILVEGIDDSGGVRIIRLKNHPFFLLTLFQPQRSSLKSLVHPLIREFLSVSLCQPTFVMEAKPESENVSHL
jgi:CTP synthase (UTP-ammonia lyase)